MPNNPKTFPATFPSFFPHDLWSRLQERLERVGQDLRNRCAARGLDALEVLSHTRTRQLPAPQHQRREGEGPRFGKAKETLTSPHHGPAAHQSAPSQTSEDCISQSALCTAATQTSLEPAPISPRKPLRPTDASHAVASCRRSLPIVDETHVADVPEPSESRYWCISGAREAGVSGVQVVTGEKAGLTYGDVVIRVCDVAEDGAVA